MASSVEQEQHRTMGTTAVSSENVQGCQGTTTQRKEKTETVFSHILFNILYYSAVNRQGYVSAIFTFHFNILHGFKVLAPGQGREIPLPSWSVQKKTSKI